MVAPFGTRHIKRIELAVAVADSVRLPPVTWIPVWGAAKFGRSWEAVNVAIV
jgi:hypothetical protein